MSPKTTPSRTAIAKAIPGANSTVTAAAPTITPSVFDHLPDSALLRETDLVRSPKRPNATAPLPFSAATPGAWPRRAPSPRRPPLVRGPWHGANLRLRHGWRDGNMLKKMNRKKGFM